jgi:translocation and assembly module TamB
MSPWRRRLLRFAAALVLLLTGLFAVGFLVFQSAWLREQIRRRALTEIARATGGRPEMSRFDFDPASWQVTIEGFVLHGTEPPAARPLFRAPRIRLGLKLLSFLNRKVDLQSVDIQSPEFHLLRREDGSTNLPSPAAARPRSGAPLAPVVALAIDAFTVHNGLFTYNQTQAPFAFSGRDLELGFTYSPDENRYDGAMRSSAFTADLPGFLLPHFAGDLSTELSVFADSITLHKFRADAGRHAVEGLGAIRDLLHPKITLKLSAHSDLAETRLGAGPIATAGVFSYSAEESYRYEGEASGRDLVTGYAEGINVRGRVLLTPDGARLTNVAATSPEGRFTGEVAVPGYRALAVQGQVANLSLAAAARRLRLTEMPYSGAITGPVTVAGPLAGPWDASGDLTIAPGAGGIPVEGLVRVRYQPAQNQLSFADSYLATPASRIAVSGTLNQTVRVRATTTRLEDLPVKDLPFRLEQGSLQFEGTVTGDIRTPQIAGRVAARGLRYDRYLAASAAATIVLSPTRLDVSGLTAEVERALLEGSGTLLLAGWKPVETAPLHARLTARNVNFKLIPAAVPVVGLVSGAATVAGTLRMPEIAATLEALRPLVRGELYDAVRATARLRGSELPVSSLEAVRGAARLSGSGRAVADGPFAAEVTLTGLALADWKDVREQAPGLGGVLRATARLAGVIRQRQPQLSSLEVDAGLSRLSFNKKPLGELSLKGRTENGNFAFDAAGRLRNAEVRGTGNYRLTDGYPGSGSLSFAELPLDLWNDLRPEPLPFTGAISAQGRFSGPAFAPEKWQAELAIPLLALVPARGGPEFALRNDGPLHLSADRGAITIKRARFVAKDTSLAATGSFSLAQRRPWDLRINGSLNLAGLKSFSSEILASGIATVEANVRGEFSDPQLFGRLDLRDAALSIDDISTGLDQVTGRVLFDRRRATIENKLTAQAGGGELALSGFVDFGEAETFYRLQAAATGVRIRYPEGLSTVADGTLSLTGSPTQSLLGGNITIQRSGFQPRTDLGSLLSDAAASRGGALSTNPFLSNMQLDVRVRTGPNTRFTTTLTSDLQADANLNVRGSAARPVVQGRITVNQGEVNFFGGKYTIKRGEVSFYNTSKIEPVLDMDVETRVRAVTVGINFSGPINKLNVSYRSDPPLAPTEIIALLTVGRSPDSISYTSQGNQQSGSFLQTGANTLLGNAISAPISSQLQRFFGVSRLKIDPLISGLEGTPQARLTVEQQVSKDVTVTFVTTLNRSQQQVVRLEWNLSREWSVIALRDENGSFGLDFQIRKQLR